MFEAIGNMFGSKAKKNGSSHSSQSSHSPGSTARQESGRRQTFTKPFRWRLPEGETTEPGKVEVVGSFTAWERVPMTYDKHLRTWYVTLHDVEGNRTHHYVLLVDGQPTFDEQCDGLAVPHGPHEKRYQIETTKGPRVMMLFGQTK